MNNNFPTSLEELIATLKDITECDDKDTVTLLVELRTEVDAALGRIWNKAWSKV